MKLIKIYTDGSCSGNPGPGGWGVILSYNNRTLEKSGGEEMTTNNRMELTAVINGLKSLTESCEVEIYSDSTYVVNAFNKGWLENWKRKGYYKKGNPIPNVELWKELDDLVSKHVVRFVWVKGHADNEYNNRCDEMAVAESCKFKR